MIPLPHLMSRPSQQTLSFSLLPALPVPGPTAPPWSEAVRETAPATANASSMAGASVNQATTTRTAPPFRRFRTVRVTAQATARASLANVVATQATAVMRATRFCTPVPRIVLVMASVLLP